MNIGDEVKVKGEFKKMLVDMPEFSKIDLKQTMTIVGFEWPKALVKENSKKWRVSWLEIVQEEVKKSGKKTRI